MKSAILEPELKDQPKPAPETERRYIERFREIGIKDVPLVGGKTASLGEMFRELTPKGVNVPDGFAITAQAYRDFLREAGLDNKIDNLVRKVIAEMEKDGLGRGERDLEVYVMCVEQTRDNRSGPDRRCRPCAFFARAAQKIDSISLNPDTVLKTTLAISEKETAQNQTRERTR
jgi:phosphoenolpyruvate synthase/pyruvate phosphate dikinase